MPTLVLQDLPVDVFESLSQSASRRQVSPEEEAKRVLRELFGKESNGRNGSKCEERLPAAEHSIRLPDEPFLTEEISAPFDLPRPGEGVVVRAVWGGERLPDPIDVAEKE